MKIRLTLLLIILGILPVAAQTDSDCKSLLKAVHANLKLFSDPDREQGAYISYEIENSYDDGGVLKKSEDQVKMYIKDKRTYITGNQSTLYQDTVTMVVIMPFKKVIFISDKTASKFDKLKEERAGILRQEMLEGSQIIRCSEMCADNKITLTKIECLPNDKIKSKGIRQVDFYIDKSQKLATKINIVFDEKKTLIEQTIKITAMNLNYKASAFKGSALSKVLTNSGKLLSKYKGYKIVDARVEK